MIRTALVVAALSWVAVSVGCAADASGDAPTPPPPSWAGTWHTGDAGATTTTMTLVANDASGTIRGNGSEGSGGGRTFQVSGDADEHRIEFVFDAPPIARAAFAAADTERFSFAQVSDAGLVLVRADDVQDIRFFSKSDAGALQERTARPPSNAAFDSNGGARL